MRLRQAHAILEAGDALTELGFELDPVDHDAPGAYPHIDEDHLCGSYLPNDEDSDHVYLIYLEPGETQFEITVRMAYGPGPDSLQLLEEDFTVWSWADGEVRPFDTGGTAQRVVALVRNAITAHENSLADE